MNISRPSKQKATMKAENGTNSKVDMSLDEIIKLNQKEARKKKQNQQTTATRGGRQKFTSSRQKLRVAAGGIRLRSLKQKRLSRNNRPVQESSTQPQVPAKNKRVFTARNIRPSRSVALAVLRRAQRTAAAAAKTAADATALLQRNRIQRQKLFDQRRSLQPASRIAYERRRARRRSAPVPELGSRTAYNTSRVIGRSWEAEQQSLSFQGRPRRKSRQILEIPRGRRTSFRGTSQNGSSRISTPSRNQRWIQRSTFRGNSRGRQRSNYTLPINSRPASRARNAEYLAQARALIRAQSEHAQRYNLDDTPTTSLWAPRSYSAPRRNLNYYAKYWDS
ncbi:unnamed protein product [Heterobilharzia americana]|nr:unnamed protein product [Heterobilharzia americana]CAH8639520.1 unnamed protein product [Heterobilharzia americana]